MKRAIALTLVAATVALTAFSSAAAGTTATANAPVDVATVAVAPAAAATPVVATVATAAVAVPVPARAPAHAVPAVAATPAPVTKKVTASAPKAAVTTMPAAAAPSTDATRTAYINALYASVVPAAQRAALAGRYVLGYNLPGLGCGTGCTGRFGDQARSSFNSTFFSESLTYQRSRIAHEAAHAYGFLFISNYASPSWAGIGGWQTQFNSLDRSFVKTYDAEAFAACVAWKETGFNNRVNQISSVCTASAAALAMAQIQ